VKYLNPGMDLEDVMLLDYEVSRSMTKISTCMKSFGEEETCLNPFPPHEEAPTDNDRHLFSRENGFKVRANGDQINDLTGNIRIQNWQVSPSPRDSICLSHSYCLRSKESMI